jgi:pyrrolidone-carboxylate peptidase
MSKLSLKILLLSGLVSLPSLGQTLPLDVEEARLALAQSAMPLQVSRYQALTEDLGTKLTEAKDELLTTKMVANQGLRLWQQAVRDVQSGGLDDRPLYWSRLAMRSQLKQQAAGFKIADWQRDILVRAAEKSSRGFSDIEFADDARIKILLTGFDPFFLDKDIGQSNPSGLAALALDGYRFTVNGRQAQIESMMIPVRFADFDRDLIESLLTPLYREKRVDMLVTVSMGREDLDLERFPGRNRSVKAPDNLNVLTGAAPERPLAPMLNGKTLNGPEFVEFSLPVAAMQAVQGRWKVNDNTKVRTLSRGEFSARSLNELNNEIAVEGSGGGYLSNEISYRAVLLAQQFNAGIPVGHIHTPRVQGHDATTEGAIVEQIRAMLEAAAGTL